MSCLFRRLPGACFSLLSPLSVRRCIRHSLDFGAIFLLDGRYNNDHDPSTNMSLPKWMRHSVRTLRKDMVGLSKHDILGGFKGLVRELDSFFLSAKEYTEMKKEEQRESRYCANNTGSAEYTFDSELGRWSPQKKVEATSIVHDVVPTTF